MCGRIIIADKSDIEQRQALETAWGVQSVPAYFDKQGKSDQKESNWAVAICYWHQRGNKGAWLYDAIDPIGADDFIFILIHVGYYDLCDAGLHSNQRGVFTWSRGQSDTGPGELGDILADLAAWRQGRRKHEYFKRGVKLLREALKEAAADSSLTRASDRSGKAAEVFNNGREEAGLPRMGRPPDSLLVLIHDTVGAIDPFVLDVRNLLDGRCELEEFKAYWEGKAATGVRRLRAWLDEASAQRAEKEWLERTRLDQYPPGDEAKQAIGKVLDRVPEILGQVDEGKLQGKPNPDTLDELRSWLRELKEQLEGLRNSDGA